MMRCKKFVLQRIPEVQKPDFLPSGAASLHLMLDVIGACTAILRPFLRVHLRLLRGIFSHLLAHL